MPDAEDLAERYRDMAEWYRRLAADSSIEKRDQYLRFAEHYSKMAEAAAYKRAGTAIDPLDRSDQTDGDAPPAYR